MCEDKEKINQLEKENQDLRTINTQLQQFNIDLSTRYSETMSMFDDAIHILSTVRYQRKLDRILERKNETSTDSV